ncbi:MAG: phage portal protein [Dehalococcoidia bacterium]|nr:phage portal protein [Dehalococcoidia bacterium]
MRLGKFHFGYNAVEDKQRRQSPQTRVRHESDILTKTKRTKLLATAQDQARNHALVAWMVRKHLDYVSKFHISFRTGKTDLDTLVNRIFRWHGKPGNLDFGGRFGRDELFRLFEMEKVLCGDAALLKLDDLKLQAIESDLIAKGENAPDNVNDSGLVVDRYGRVEKYALCKRPAIGSNPIHERLAERDEIIFDAYWTRFSSQFRGVSPLSVAINTVQDIHEAFEFNLIKAKMHALFGVAVFRDANGSNGNFGGAAGATRETTSATSTATGTSFDLNPRAVNLIDLNSGDDVKILESGTPSTQFVEASYLFIQIAMLALDIPVTSFDSRRSSFAARIADLNEYEVSVDYKRTKNRYVRQAYSDWVLEEIWNDASTPWPLKSVAARNGMQLRDVQEEIEWIPSGSPWLDKYSQLQGDQLGIDIYLDNPIDAARRRGSDVFANIDKIAQVRKYAEAAGVPPPVQSGATPAATDDEPELPENDAGKEGKKENEE